MTIVMVGDAIKCPMCERAIIMSCSENAKRNVTNRPCVFYASLEVLISKPIDETYH